MKNLHLDKKKVHSGTGKSLSEALIFASIKPQYDNDKTCSVLAVFMVILYMTHLLSYCGLIDVRISASEKDLPVKRPHIGHKNFGSLSRSWTTVQILTIRSRFFFVAKYRSVNTKKNT